jgi:FkbM family methyltransferase
MTATQLAPAPLWVRATRPIVRTLPGRYRAVHWICEGRTDRFVADFPSGGSGLRFVCDLRDGIAREVCFTGRYGPQETRLLRHFLTPGMTFVDVGANWGYFTLLAASLVGPRGRVLALEPEPRLFGLLEQNLRLNDLEHVTAIRAAASDRRSNKILHAFEEDGGNWGESSLALAPPGALSAEVEGCPLDAAAARADLTTIDLVKIDVEGHELQVLAGMSEGLESGRYRRLIVEWHPAALPSPITALERAFDSLENAGYRGWWIDHTLAATRSAAYGGPVRLYPVHAGGFDDAWPHTLWIAAGEPDPGDV